MKEKREKVIIRLKNVGPCGGEKSRKAEPSWRVTLEEGLATLVLRLENTKKVR